MAKKEGWEIVEAKDINHDKYISKIGKVDDLLNLKWMKFLNLNDTDSLLTSEIYYHPKSIKMTFSYLLWL
jgi:hypothetical protein